MDARPQASTGPQDPLQGARVALILLLLINMFNYIDRQVLAAVLSKLEVEFTPSDPNAKFKMGALTTAFMVAYMLLAPVFGWFGDRMNRWVLVGVGVILWSLATGASGLALSYLMLLLTRCLVGIGEAAYGPVAPGIISDLYPVARRGSVLAWFYSAIPVGSALGYVMGGAVAKTAWGWRGAFLVVVIPGILLGLWALRMPEPPRGQVDRATTHRPRSWKDFKVLLQTHSYVLNTLGMTAMTFVLGGVGAFMPTYVYEREGRFALTAAAIERFAERAEAERAPVSEDLLQRLRARADGTEYSHERFREHVRDVFEEGQEGVQLLRLMEASETEDSLGLAGINLIFGVIVVVSGLAATLLGGLAGDRLLPHFSGSYFLVAGVGMLIAFPFFLGVLIVPFPLAWIVMFVAVFFLFFNTGPTNTILANVTHPSIRASAFALNILIIHALGDAISPSIIGAMADRTSLATAYAYVSFLIPVSGLFWLWGAVYLKRDTELAPTRMGTDT
jgi:MFS family permease